MRSEETKRMENTNFAAQWQEQIEATIERDFEGVRGRFRRVNVHEWMRQGRLPQFFADTIRQSQSQGVAATVDEDSITQEELVDYHNFKRDFVIAATVEPKIVAEDRELKEGEVSYSLLHERCPDIVEGIFRWTIAGSPDISVKTKGGETSIAEIDSFRSGGEDKSAPVSGDDLQADKSEAERSVGDA